MLDVLKTFLPLFLVVWFVVFVFYLLKELISLLYRRSQRIRLKGKIDEYIDNANTPQKVFLFVGLVAFVVWFVEVDWELAFDRWGSSYFFGHFFDVLFHHSRQPALFAMFASVVGSYIFKSK